MDAKFEYAKVSCTVNIVFQMTTSTHAQFPILPEESWVTEIIRMYVRYVWTGKFDLNADTCGKTKGRKKWEIQLGSELALFLSFFVLIASNILSSSLRGRQLSFLAKLSSACRTTSVYISVQHWKLCFSSWSSIFCAAIPSTTNLTKEYCIIILNFANKWK